MTRARRAQRTARVAEHRLERRDARGALGTRDASGTLGTREAGGTLGTREAGGTLGTREAGGALAAREAGGALARSAASRRFARISASFALLAALPAGAEPCAPRAALDGDAAAVATVAAELRRLGVATTGRLDDVRTAGCPTVSAEVELDQDGGIAVAVRDRTHRSEGRVVSDPALAAAWIDSWLRDDFDAPLAEPAAPSPVLSPPGESVRVATPPAEAPWLDRISLAADFDQTWSGESTRWSGISGAACARFARFPGTCIGLRGRYATQDVRSGSTAAARTDASVLATASHKFEIGSMRISPELGLGIGRVTTTRIDGCKPVQPPMCDPNDPMCLMPPTDCTTADVLYVGDGFTSTTWSPRISGALRVAVPLFDHVWLDGIAQLGFAPLAHAAPYPYDAMQPNVPPTDPSVDLSVPGEPVSGFTLGAGIRVGAP